MQIITFLLRSSWLTVAVAVLMGGLSGAGSALMLASVNAAITLLSKIQIGFCLASLG
ncbi:MAG: hypothetical protein WBB18_15150 [Nodosilinea sp.]